jgi:hypothetical protein
MTSTSHWHGNDEDLAELVSSVIPQLIEQAPRRLVCVALPE